MAVPGVGHRSGVQATIIAMLVCVLAAGIVMAAVAWPRMRQGARVLTPSGREQVKDARRRAVSLAKQGRERAVTASEQARSRGERSSRTPTPPPAEVAVTDDVSSTATPTTSSTATGRPARKTTPRPASVTASLSARSAEETVIDVRAIESAMAKGSPQAQASTVPARSAAADDPAASPSGTQQPAVAAQPVPVTPEIPVKSEVTVPPRTTGPPTAAESSGPSERPAVAATAGAGGQREVPGVIPGVSPRSAHRMSLWNPSEPGARHAR